MPLATEDTLGIAIISLVFIVGGYVAVFALWYGMVYRPSRAERRASRAAATADERADADAGDPEP